MSASTWVGYRVKPRPSAQSENVSNSRSGSGVAGRRSVSVMMTRWCLADPVRRTLGPVDRTAVMAAFTEQLRRNATPGDPGARVERDDRVVRIVNPAGWSGVVWSDLDAASA